MFKNKTIKLFLMLGVILFIFFGNVGCNNNSNDNEQIISEIKQDYFNEFVASIPEKNVDDIIINYYIGEYNGYYILMLSYKGEAIFDIIGTIYFGEAELTYYDSNIFRAWKNGTFYDLKELYKSEELSMNDIKKIIKQYNTMYLENLGLKEEIELDIKRSYISNFCNNEIGLDEIKIERYYGCYNSYYAILIKELNKGDIGALRDVVIEDLTFSYPYSNREILLWKSGEFVNLTKAYENGLIQKDDLIKINQMFNS